MKPATAELPRKRLKWDFDKPVTLLEYEHVHTVCEESRCPNRHECSAAGVATFLIGGRICTRSCKFCHIATGRGEDLSLIADAEMKDILEYTERNRLRSVVITSVARDDDEIALAQHFAKITRALNERGVATELLIPDFHGRAQCLDIIAAAKPLVLAHNIETVRRLSREVRPQASHDRSLKLYDYLSRNWPQVILKAGFMVGLGETFGEVKELLNELREHQVEIVTVGQYMQPSNRQRAVNRIYNSEEFNKIEELIKLLGFAAWEVGPFVRSSYMAGRTMERVIAAKQRRLNGGTV